MSTALGTTRALVLNPAALAGVPLPQSISWWSLAAPWRLIGLWAERGNQRRALAELADTPHRLDDIGFTRVQALREAAKPFWQA